MGVLKVIIFLVIPVLVAIFFLTGKEQKEPPKMIDNWWGLGPRPVEEKPLDKTKPVKFSIGQLISNVTMIDLRLRLHNARLPNSFEGTGFEYGVHSEFLRGAIFYWKEKYDWPKQQAKLDSMPQFTVNIEGIDIHYVHAKPAGKNEGNSKRVIMLLHGWPGSFWEFYKVIPLLTESQDGPFEVICPSIPGYGFSEAPHRPGFDGTDAARIFSKLMTILGHDKFYIQGGDWGSFIGTFMAKAYPERVLGVHVNMVPLPRTSLAVWGRMLLGGIIPSLVYSETEMKTRIPLKQLGLDLLQETGYFHIQATKPDTIGAALTDSPAGLAAYILEKFSTWSNKANRKCPDGCILKHFTLDEVLTNVMIYWLSGNVASSMRLYKEMLSSTKALEWESIPVSIPSGVANFPHEVVPHVRSLVELQHHNIVHYTHLPRGGHFPALEEPQLMADDIKYFVKAVEDFRNKPKQP